MPQPVSIGKIKTPMKSCLLPLLLIVVATACHCDKNEPQPTLHCGVANPAENLPWLKAIIDEYKFEISGADVSENSIGYGVYQYVLQSTYQGNTVFIFGNCCPNCNSVFLVKDCEGKVLDVPATEVNGPTTVIWKHEHSPCVFTQ